MKHVSLQICERSQERKERIVVFAGLEAAHGTGRATRRHWGCSCGSLETGTRGSFYLHGGEWNIDLSRFLLDLFYCLYDVIIIFNTSDLIFLATPIPFRKPIPFHGFVLCTNIPLTEDQTNLISLMPLLGFQIIP